MNSESRNRRRRRPRLRYSLLSDPLRLRLVHAFADEPRTTKQVATVLGEKPTRLYHHVARLEQAELLELVEARPVRGTTEKYHRSVGRAFAASPTLFRGPEGAGPAQELIDGILSQTGAEFEGVALDTLDHLHAISRREFLHRSHPRLPDSRREAAAIHWVWVLQRG